MTNEEMVIKLTEHEDNIENLKRRMKTCEEGQKEQTKLLIVVNKLATNMDNMVREQREMREELNKLEQEPIDDFKHYKRLIVGCVLTTIIGLIFGLVLGNYLV